MLSLSAGDRELQQARVHRDEVIQPRARIGASAVQRIHLNLSIAKSYHRAVESWRAIPLGSAFSERLASADRFSRPGVRFRLNRHPERRIGDSRQQRSFIAVS